MLFANPKTVKQNIFDRHLFIVIANVVKQSPERKPSLRIKQKTTSKCYFLR